MNTRGALTCLTSAAIALATPARAQVADTATTHFSVDGVNVIVRRNPASQVVAANVYLLGGVQRLTPATQGIEAFYLAVGDYGSAHFPGTIGRTLLARLGSSISASPERDFTVYSLRTVRSALDSSWRIFADRLTSPTLTTADVERVRGELLTSLRQQRAEPDAAVHALADSLLYRGSAYALDPAGTVESIAAITPQALREWQHDALQTTRMLVVVVGDVDAVTVRRLVHDAFGSLPAGSYRWTAPAVLAPPPGVAILPRQLPTNYILGYYPGPPAGTREYTALRLATAVLSGRFFTDIRSQQNLSYAVEAPFVEQAQSAGGFYVTTTKPDTTLRLMEAEVARLKSETLSPTSIARLVQQFITDYYLRNETNADQATELARAQLYSGDYRASDQFVARLREITPDDIRRAVERYMHDPRMAYVGDPAAVSHDLLAHF